MRGQIKLQERAIARAIPRVADGLAKYRAIQAEVQRADVATDREFQRRFNGFYRVRRGAEWQRAFYRILSRQRSRRDDFGTVLRQLHRATGRIEASFASKLVATFDPASPVIDSIVLRNLGLRLLTAGPPASRIERAVAVHSALVEIFASYLSTAGGKHLVRRFEQEYPKTGMTPIKMLDLVLWQSRD